MPRKSVINKRFGKITTIGYVVPYRIEFYLLHLKDVEKASRRMHSKYKLHEDVKDTIQDAYMHFWLYCVQSPVAGIRQKTNRSKKALIWKITFNFLISTKVNKLNHKSRRVTLLSYDDSKLS